MFGDHLVHLNLINNEEREVFKYELGCRLHTFSKSLLSEGEYSAARTQAVALKEEKDQLLEY